MIAPQKIAIAGAGAIGCFVGGMLAAAGRDVALLARPRVIAEIEANGLQLTSFEGLERRIAASELALSDDPAIFADAAVVLVTVKSADTVEIADAHRAARTRPMQWSSACRTASAMSRCCAPDCRAVACWLEWCRSMWWQRARANFVRTTSGDIVIERDEAGNRGSQLSVPGLKMRADRQHRRRAMGQAAGQSQQRAQRALRIVPLRQQLADRSPGAGCWPTR